MDVRDAIALIAPAVPRGGTWAELGAGSGTFTRGLASLVGPTGRVLAVERDRRMTERLARLGGDPDEAEVHAVVADFTGALDLPPLDGVLLANSLHFVPSDTQAETLERIARRVRAGGRVVLVEYEREIGSRWVPYPVAFARLRELGRAAGLGAPMRVGERRSAVGGTMYAAWLEVPVAPR